MWALLRLPQFRGAIDADDHDNRSRYRQVGQVHTLPSAYAQRSRAVAYESIRRWVLSFGLAIARELRARRAKPHGRCTSTRPPLATAAWARRWKRACFLCAMKPERGKGSSRPDRRSGSSLHAATYNVFTLARHLTTARTHRLFRAEAFATWREAAGVCA
jgi:hypothetical protein